MIDVTKLHKKSNNNATAALPESGGPSYLGMLLLSVSKKMRRATRRAAAPQHISKHSRMCWLTFFASKNVRRMSKASRCLSFRASNFFVE